MEKEELIFAKRLEQLKDTARLQKNVLTEEQVKETFEDMNLVKEQLELIYDYLRKNHIGIGEEIPEEEVLSKEDVNFLQMYLEELEELEEVTDGEKRAIFMSAMAEDDTAQDKLVELFLKQVVDIAKLYAGQGAFIEDLIGEGNVAVTNGSRMVGCLESPDEIDGFIGKMIMDAMEAYIEENAGEKEVSEKALNQVNRIADAAKQLAEELHRKVTVSELANELNVEEDEVLEAVRISANHIEEIEDGMTDGE